MCVQCRSLRACGVDIPFRGRLCDVPAREVQASDAVLRRVPYARWRRYRSGASRNDRQFLTRSSSSYALARMPHSPIS